MPTSKWGVVTVVATAIVWASGNSGHAQALTDFNKLYQDAPTVFASLSGLSTQRSQPSGGTIVGNSPFTGTSFSDAHDFDYGRSTNIDATIGFRFWRTEAIEARFTNFDSNSSHNFVTPGNFIGAGFTGPGGTLFQGQASTTMQSWEINWRHQLFDQFTVLAGFRNIKLGDTLGYAINTTVAKGQYNYNNNLRGGQIGVDWAILPLANPFQVNLWGKIGLYDLHTEGGIFEFNGGNPIGSFTGSAREHAYASEAGITLGYRLSSTVMVRAGYQALWLNDLGLASNAAARSLLNPGLLLTVGHDDLLLQSASIGLAIGY